MKAKLFSFFTFLFLSLSGISYAQEYDGPPAPVRDQDFMQTLIMLSVAAVFFYLILWRPEQKRRKEVEDKREGMKQGDRVTAMGIVGTILRVMDETVILKMYDGSKIEFLKHAVSDVAPASEEESKKLEKSDKKDQKAGASS